MAEAHNVSKEQSRSSLLDPVLHDEVQAWPVAPLALKLPKALLLQLGDPAGEQSCAGLGLGFVVSPGCHSHCCIGGWLAPATCTARVQHHIVLL